MADKVTGQSFYRLQVALQGDPGITLTPGMRVQGFVLARAQAPAEWLLAPLANQIAHAWRER